MKEKLLLLFLCCSSIYLSGQQEQLKEQRLSNHFIYVTPTSLPGNMIDLDNFWAQAGYGWLKNKSMYCFDIGAIVYSLPTRGSGYAWSELTQTTSNGYAFSFEHKYFIINRFYYATQIYFQYMETKREETVSSAPDYILTTSPYSVFRNETGIIPKVGFSFINKGKLSCDIGIGAGIRYISSKSAGKQNLSGNLQKEYFANKLFDSGNKIAQRIMLQFRIGYSF